MSGKYAALYGRWYEATLTGLIYLIMASLVASALDWVERELRVPRVTVLS